MKLFASKSAAVAALVGVLTLGGAPAHAAYPSAKSSAVLVKAWPSSTTVLSPPKGAIVGLYHNGKKTLVSTPKCTSRIAEQGTFYNWATIAGSRQPLFSQPIYVIKCR
jgi:hypothetical protein